MVDRNNPNHQPRDLTEAELAAAFGGAGGGVEEYEAFLGSILATLPPNVRQAVIESTRGFPPSQAPNPLIPKYVPPLVF